MIRVINFELSKSLGRDACSSCHLAYMRSLLHQQYHNACYAQQFPSPVCSMRSSRWAKDEQWLYGCQAGMLSRTLALVLLQSQSPLERVMSSRQIAVLACCQIDRADDLLQILDHSHRKALQNCELLKDYNQCTALLSISCTKIDKSVSYWIFVNLLPWTPQVGHWGVLICRIDSKHHQNFSARTQIRWQGPLTSAVPAGRRLPAENKNESSWAIQCSQDLHEQSFFFLLTAIWTTWLVKVEAARSIASCI